MLTTDDQQALLAWYDHHQRDLPWRRTRDPWSILLSEVLLQQTQVTRGLVYWRRMVETFPTVASMSRASVDAVLKAWEGAGYYSRARRLHALSQRVMLTKDKDGFNGELPGTYAELLTLPGIGPYTAAAVASIAFGQPVACVDGNIRRVMARHTAQTEPTAKDVQDWADAALQIHRPGDWNQALMELGATVCTPRRVRCEACPLVPSCRGRAAPERYPTAKKQRKIDVELTVVVELASDGYPVLSQRPMSGMFAGLWGPQYAEGPVEHHPSTAFCGTLRHELSHRRFTVHVHRRTNADCSTGTPPDSVALSALDIKVLELATVPTDKSR
ncbi:MAG: A/G-specific adenine glycosylase [Euryarchaeota archaeon]|nr:A/G-specific adenine glycosylase [Euryarchaeota archaeon]